MSNINFENEGKYNSDFVNLLEPGNNTKNWVSLIISFGVYGFLIYLLADPSISNTDKKNAGIALGSLSAVGILISILRIPIFGDTSKTSWPAFLFNFVFITLFGVPVYFADLFLGYTSKGVPGGMKDLSHREIHDNFGSVSRVKSLGYDTNRFTFLNTFSYRKGSFLPCKFDSGSCVVRRSVVYIAILLSLIIIIPLLVNLGELKENKFNIDNYLGYLNSIIAGVLGTSVVLILGTVRNADIVKT